MKTYATEIYEKDDKLHYTVNVTYEDGVGSDLNAGGYWITSPVDLISFIEELYKQSCFSEDVQVSILTRSEERVQR